jgi:predicted TIM-barrel fold metal-dependent hydrolase
MAVTVERQSDVGGEIAVRIVDCDVHPMGATDDFVEFVPEPYRTRYLKAYLPEVEMHSPVYIPPTQTIRQDAIPPAGGRSDPALLEQQLLRAAHVDYAMLLFLTPRSKPDNPEFESALFSGMNEAMSRTWLGTHNWHGRYRGAIRVCPYDPPGAVREIEKWAGHPYVNQVYVIPEAAAPFGHPQFRPIFEAAARHRLPIALHVMRTPGMRLLTPVGHPSYHLEIFPQWPLYFAGHATSLVFSGIFEELPDLRFVGVEGGFTWVAPLMWRLDSVWRALGGPTREVPRPPSEYLRTHFRFTTQPIEEPEPLGNLLKVMEWMHAEDVLMFATDYPHYDYDDPSWLQPRLPKEHRDRIFAGNAIELYGLPRTRPVDRLDREG